MIDIVVMQETDQVVMSIEFAGTVLDASIAKSLVKEWGTLVKKTLKDEQTCKLC